MQIMLRKVTSVILMWNVDHVRRQSCCSLIQPWSYCPCVQEFKPWQVISIAIMISTNMFCLKQLYSESKVLKLTVKLNVWFFLFVFTWLFIGCFNPIHIIWEKENYVNLKFVTLELESTSNRKNLFYGNMTGLMFIKPTSCKPFGH